MFSHRIEREMEYLAKTTLPLNSIGIIHSLPVFRIVPLFGIIFTHIYIIDQRGRKSKRAFISLKYLFLPIHAKGGENSSPKQKDRTTKAKGPHHHQFQKCSLLFGIKRSFSIGILLRYNFKLVYPLQN
jgi:hypothetical protein